MMPERPDCPEWMLIFILITAAPRIHLQKAVKRRGNKKMFLQILNYTSECRACQAILLHDVKLFPK